MMKPAIIVLAFLFLPFHLYAQHQFVRSQYWFNDNFTEAISEDLDVPAESFNYSKSVATAGLDYGLHTLHIRFQDDTGEWSSALSRFFYKVPARDIADPKIASYRYWVDDDWAGRTEVSLDTPVNPFSLNSFLDMRHLTSGEYDISFQFKDQDGRWSSALTKTLDILDAYSDWAAANNIEGEPGDLTDGVPNLIRYAMGGDINTPRNELLPQLLRSQDGEQAAIILSFHRIDDPRLHYAVWWSEDLVDWGVEPIWMERAPDTPGILNIFEQNISSRGFYRLEIIRE